MPILPTLIGVGFTIYTFISGNPITDSEVKVLDYLLYTTLGTGAIGAAKAGHERYVQYKEKKP